MVHSRRGEGVRLHRQGDRSISPQGSVLLTTSVVVVSQRPGDQLRRCLESVVRQADEVLLVDNASPNDEVATAAKDASALLVRLKVRADFPAALNAGMTRATGDVLAVLSDGAVADGRWLQVSSRLLDDRTVGAVAPRIVRSGRFLEVVLRDEASYSETDGRPRGRRLVEARLGSEDVLPSITGSGIHPLESHPDGSAFKWTTGLAPFYVPLNDPRSAVELVLNGEEVRPARIVDLLSGMGSYLALDGRIGPIATDTPDDDRSEAAEERFALDGKALVMTREAFARVGRFSSGAHGEYWDADWCWRGRLLGLRMFVEPAVTVRLAPDPSPAPLAIGGSQEDVDNRRPVELGRLVTLARNAPIDLALRQAWDAPVAPDHLEIAKAFALALAQRQYLRRRWAVRPREVFERWAGLDAPLPALRI